VLDVTTFGGVDPSLGRVTVRGDGEVVIQPGLARGHAAPEPLVLRAGEKGVQRTLQAARAAGLLDSEDVGSSHLTDRAVTTIEIRASHQRRMISVRARLDPAGDRGLTGRERQARRALRRFVHLALEPSFYRRAHRSDARA
jgi:hypothetical protein